MEREGECERLMEEEGRERMQKVEGESERLSATPSRSVHVAHGCKIRSFDWSLGCKSTILTCFPAVDSLLALSLSTVTAGAVDFPDLQIIDLQKGLLKKTLHWENSNFSSSSTSTVQGIEASEEYLFGSFETCRWNASVIVAKKKFHSVLDRMK